MDQTWPIDIPGVEPIRAIGTGGFGQVWLARQTDLEREVAVKIGHRPFTDSDDRRRFERECKALGRLSGHPNIIGVHTTGFHRELPYLVLEYVDGGTLEEHGPALTVEHLRAVASHLCAAISAVHSLGILHRDLKPANVFLRGNGHAVLGDFGIARIDGAGVTASGLVTASMAFAPPEILNGSPASQAADIYGIGITIAAAVIGASPFIGRNPTSVDAIVTQVLQADPPDLRSHGLSPEFADLLRSTMAKDPTARPPTADALHQAISSLAEPAHDGPRMHAPLASHHAGPETTPVSPPHTRPEAPSDGASGAASTRATPGPPLEPDADPAGSAHDGPRWKPPLWIGVGAAATVLVVAALAGVVLAKRGDDKVSTDVSETADELAADGSNEQSTDDSTDAAVGSDEERDGNDGDAADDGGRVIIGGISTSTSVPGSASSQPSTTSDITATTTAPETTDTSAATTGSTATTSAPTTTAAAPITAAPTTDTTSTTLAPRVTAPPVTTPPVTTPPVTAPVTTTTAAPPPPPPLSLPLTVADVTAVSAIPIDGRGMELLNGPANSPQFCNVRPDITGLVETKASIYPTDSALRVMAQRVLRFGTPQQAATFVKSASVVPCDRWESREFSNEGITVLTAQRTTPSTSYGDETTQIDQVSAFPVGVDGHSRTIFVRKGTDVLKIFYTTIDKSELGPVGNGLTARAAATLGY